MIRTLAVTGLNLVSHINSQNFYYHSTQVFSGKIFLPGAFLLWKATSELFFVNNFSLVHLSRGQFHPNYSPVKKWSFPLRIYSVMWPNPQEMRIWSHLLKKSLMKKKNHSRIFSSWTVATKFRSTWTISLWYELISYKETLANL